MARLQDQYHKLIIPLIKSEQSFDYAGPALGIPVWDFNQKLIFYQKPNLSFKRPKLVAPSLAVFIVFLWKTVFCVPYILRSIYILRSKVFVLCCSYKRKLEKLVFQMNCKQVVSTLVSMLCRSRIIIGISSRCYLKSGKTRFKAECLKCRISYL